MDHIGSYVEATEDLVAEQAPLVVQEIILVGRAKAAFSMLTPLIIAFLVMIVGVIMGRFRARVLTEGRLDTGDDAAEVMFAGSVVCKYIVPFVCVCVALSFVPDLLETVFAPRLYVLQQIAEFVK